MLLELSAQQRRQHPSKFYSVILHSYVQVQIGQSQDQIPDKATHGIGLKTLLLCLLPQQQQYTLNPLRQASIYQFREIGHSLGQTIVPMGKEGFMPPWRAVPMYLEQHIGAGDDAHQLPLI